MNYFVIGNAESRKNINISKLVGFKVGCNAIYLHEKVDMLSAFDKFWMDKITKETNIPLLCRKNNCSAQTTIQMYKNGMWLNTDTMYRGYSSGMGALDYIAQHANNMDKIYLIGFDFNYRGDTVDHIYKGTPNHPPATARAQNANVFLKECMAICKRYPLKQIIYVNNIPCAAMKNQLSINEFLKVVTN